MTREQEIGLNLKRARENRGMTQQQLADKANTTVQNISKFENKGLNNYTWIESFQDILGVCLTNDSADIEGEIGEVGKEILLILVSEEGFIAYENIKDKLFGMTDDRVSKEFLKLAKIGMCIREQYKDFNDKNRDDVFLTAKGLITIKNLVASDVLNNRLKGTLSSVRTYEKILAKDSWNNIPEASTYQEFVNFRQAERLIRNLPITENFYKVNFILYLKSNYENGIRPESLRFVCHDYDERYYPSFSCYHDILCRKVLGLTNQALKDYCTPDFQGSIREIIDFMDQEIEKYSGVHKELGIYRSYRYYEDWEKLIEDFGIEKEVQECDDALDERIDNLDETQKELYKEFEDKFSEEDRLGDAKKVYMQLWKEKQEAGINSEFPGEWFSTEELIEFIDEIFPEASTPEERQIDRDLAKIWELLPNVREYFYRHDWGKGGMPEEIEAAIEKKFKFLIN